MKNEGLFDEHLIETAWKLAHSPVNFRVYSLYLQALNCVFIGTFDLFHSSKMLGESVLNVRSRKKLYTLSSGLFNLEQFNLHCNNSWFRGQNVRFRKHLTILFPSSKSRYNKKEYHQMLVERLAWITILYSENNRTMYWKSIDIERECFDLPGINVEESSIIRCFWMQYIEFWFLLQGSTQWFIER